MRLRYRIIAGFATQFFNRMTGSKTARGKPSAFPRAMFADRLQPVGRTAGMKAAGPPDQRRKYEPVNTDQGDHHQPDRPVKRILLFVFRVLLFHGREYPDGAMPSANRGQAVQKGVFRPRHARSARFCDRKEQTRRPPDRKPRANGGDSDCGLRHSPVFWWR